jgi:hypothetical protein
MGNTGKIYELGHLHNVLVMHSGNSELNGVPVYLFVGEWARTLAGPLPTLQDYIESFMKWSGRDASIHSRDSELVVMSAALNEHFGWIRERIDTSLGLIDPKGEDETAAKYEKRRKALVAKEIQSGFEFLENLPKFSGMSEASAAKALSEGNYDLEKWIDSYFGELSPEESSREILKRSASLAICRFQKLDNDLLLAFVGYGSEESFGSSVRVECRGIYAGKLQAKIEEKFGVAPDESKSAISHFAQGDAIQAFLRGYHWKTWDKLRSHLSDKLFLYNILDDKGESAQSSLIAEAFKELDEFSHETFVLPLLGTVEAMSMPSLADFAGSLVELQATFAYSQDGPATVGGFVEVATIDRVNGIQWKQRLSGETRTRSV